MPWWTAIWSRDAPVLWARVWREIIAERGSCTNSSVEVISHMPVKIRLARYGAKKKPFYRVVASDSRFPRDGRYLQVVGTYDPRDKIKGINLKTDDINQWVSRGAQVSATVKKLMKLSARSAASED